MSWGLGWKRSLEVFHLRLHFGEEDEHEEKDDGDKDSIIVINNGGGDFATKIVEIEWTAGDDEDQVALKLKSKLMVEMPPLEDTVIVELAERKNDAGVSMSMKIVRRREPLRAITLARAVGSGYQSDGSGVLIKLLNSEVASVVDDGVLSFTEHWNSVTALSLSGCGISVLPVEVTKFPLLEKLYLNNNKLSVLPPEICRLKNLKVLRADDNVLVSVPVELRQCVGLVELSLEHNKLVRPILDFRLSSPEEHLLPSNY